MKVEIKPRDSNRPMTPSNTLILLDGMEMSNVISARLEITHDSMPVFTLELTPTIYVGGDAVIHVEGEPKQSRYIPNHAMPKSDPYYTAAAKAWTRAFPLQEQQMLGSNQNTPKRRR